ncbi:RDD family protein [Dyella nitratireducens]|uniref:RDD family protein n=1 Tax=Dyella nitratireducens TaxID=1849580 RepID=A0ABQ1G045_9GAMM|nr:RDD family protein [Dyella nitratireducens]GGA34213.1 RDD family protein [Dyella nitratireducens]GLQ40831.1 RDD family protein [Dyella nitratireducens]
MLDTVREIETPEGVSLRLRAAGAFGRAQAWLLDTLLRFVVFCVGLGIFSAILGRGGVGLGMLLMFTLMWVYNVVCEVWFHGQTLGKRALGLRVVSADGTPVTLLPSVVRNLLRVVDALPGIYGVGLVTSMIDPSARRIGDIVAGTLVIHADDLPAGSKVPMAPAQPLPLPLDQDEQAAVIEFAERSPQLTPERQEELADILYPLTGREGTAAVTQITAYANGLLGRP